VDPLNYIQSNPQGIDTIASFFCETLALRPQGYPDHRLSIYHLTSVLI
jgi:hypothetical protein